MGVYLKGQLGACEPRQPQWQHWGELWSRVLVGTPEEEVVVVVQAETGAEEQVL